MRQNIGFPYFALNFLNLFSFQDCGRALKNRLPSPCCYMACTVLNGLLVLFRIDSKLQDDSVHAVDSSVSIFHEVKSS